MYHIDTNRTEHIHGVLHTVVGSTCVELAVGPAYNTSILPPADICCAIGGQFHWLKLTKRV